LSLEEEEEKKPMVVVVVVLEGWGRDGGWAS
jgi:hypothetical protein